VNPIPIRDIEDPHWQEQVLERVRRTQQTPRKKSVRRKANIQVDYDPPLQFMLKQAAEARGIGIGSYVRRAIAKQIAKDLNIPWTEVLQHCASAKPYGSVPPGAKRGQFGVRRTVDDGEGYGDWTN